MHHGVLKLYRVCVNDDPRLMLTYFWQRRIINCAYRLAFTRRGLLCEISKSIKCVFFSSENVCSGVTSFSGIFLSRNSMKAEIL